MEWADKHQRRSLHFTTGTTIYKPIKKKKKIE